jgi:mono/diheme cytochrome c family protein
MMMRTFVGAAALLLATGAFAADGAEVYKAHCAKCHGDTGHADTAAGKALKVPALAGDAKVADAAVPDLVKNIKENARHAKAGVLKDLSDADVAAAATHAKGLASSK